MLATDRSRILDILQPPTPTRRRIARSLADPLFLIQVAAMIITLSGLVYFVFGQAALKRDIRAIQHQIGARP